jgi:hypothetical protein
MALPKTDDDRRLLASILMREDEDLTAETLEGAVRALRRVRYRRQLEEVQRELQQIQMEQQRSGQRIDALQALLQEKMRLKRALMDPGLADGANSSAPF